MKQTKKLIFIPIILVLIMFFNLISQAASLPTDPNPTISVLVDCSQNEVFHYASSIRSENKSGYLKIFKKPSEFANGVEIYSTKNLNTRNVYACVDENLNLYSTSSGTTYVNKSSNDRLVRSIGAYHLQTNEVYNDFSSAENALNYFKSQAVGCFLAYINGKYVIRIGDYSSFEEASSHIEELSEYLGMSNVSFSIQSSNNKTNYDKAKNATIISANGVARNISNFPSGVYILDGKGNLTQKTANSSSLFAMGGNNSCITIVDANTGVIIMEFESSNEILSISSHDNAVIYHRNTDTDGECFAGDLNFTIKDNKIRTVNYVKTQDYLKIVVPTEIGYKYKEALKAQSVAARNFALSKMVTKRHDDVMLCNTTHCQAYQIYGSYYINDNGLLKSDVFKDIIPAVDETLGIVGVYNNKIVEIIYADSFGGQTLADADAWYSWDSSKNTYVRPVPKPYYPSIKDSFDTELYPFSFNLTKKDLYDMAYNNGKNNTNLVQVPSQIAAMGISCIEQIEVKRRSDSGIPTEIDLVNGNNRIQIKGAIHILQFFRQKVESDIAKGPNFYLNDITKPNDSEIFTITGKGWGHNVGMSQTGAKNRAQAGQDFKQILNFYYSNNLSIFKIN